MKNKVTITLLLIAMAVAGSIRAAAAPTTVKARLDSAVLLMGNVTTLHIEVVQDKGVKGYFPADRLDTLMAAVEVAGRPKCDTMDLGNNRIQINKSLIIQSFDSGMYMLPPVAYITGADTLKSNGVTLKVVPVKVNQQGGVQDFKPVEQVPFKLFDWVPDFISDYWWIYLLVFLLVACSLAAYFVWFRKGINPLKPVKKRLPPYDEAMQGLAELKQRQLWQNGEEKEYYTVLTDILRVYIFRRFKVNAVEMTSSQIVDTLKKNEETKAVNEQLSEILAMADFVKFANVKPIADDNDMAYQRALHFVEATRPVEAPAAADGKPKAGEPAGQQRKEGVK
ncbi:MAG: cell wall anchor protein [Bacteroidales bacterium]|nr:cell wall anchor protein [Bacteroidales bacterium]